MATVITIGRNIGSTPMDNAAWASFREEVAIAVRHYLGDTYFVGDGTGWSPKWGLEDAYTVVASSPFGHEEEERLLKELARVGRYYGQEAVAVTIGKTSFV